MQVKNINFLTNLEDIENIFNDNIYMSVTLENGQNYILVVGTPKNLLTLMENEKGNYISQGGPIMIIKKMIKKVVKEAIKVYAENDAYYLKFYMLLH